MARRQHSIWSQIFIDTCGNKLKRSFTFAVLDSAYLLLLFRIDQADVVLAAHGYYNSRPSGWKNASCGERPTYILPFPVFV
jgi:hypothetical protein